MKNRTTRVLLKLHFHVFNVLAINSVNYNMEYNITVLFMHFMWYKAS